MCIYHILYQTVNLINGKEYIGVHSTYNLNDGYLGSGVRLKAAIKKYGKANFYKFILKFCESQSEAYILEGELVNEEYLKRDDVYNLMGGGFGSGIGELNSFFGKTHSDKTKEMISLKNRGKCGLSGKDNPMYGRVGPNKGKRLSDETRIKISIAAKNRSDEANNKISESQKKRLSDPNARKHLSDIAKLRDAPTEDNLIKRSNSMRNTISMNSVLYETIIHNLIGLPKRTCEYCNGEFDNGNYHQHHGENCKLNPNWIDKRPECPWCGIRMDKGNYTVHHGDNCKYKPQV